MAVGASGLCATEQEVEKRGSSWKGQRTGWCVRANAWRLGCPENTLGGSRWNVATEMLLE